MIAHRRNGFTWMAQAAIATVALAAMVLTGALGAFATPAGVHVRVEGANHTLFSGTATALSCVMVDSDGATHAQDANALWALESASRLGGFPYVLKDSAFGLYIDTIADETPVPTPPYPGWLYRVDGVRPMVGADQCIASAGSEVLWYYGTYDASPTVAVVPAAAVTAGTAVQITAQQLDPDGVVSPLPDARVYVGSTVATSDASGHVSFVASTPGDYGVRVESPGCIRSAVKTLHVVAAGATTIGIQVDKATATIGQTVILAGTCAPASLVGSTMHVDVKKPGKAYWTYSSNRVIYNNAGVASWQYKYTFKSGMTKGAYAFRAVYGAALSGTVSVRLQ